MEARARKLYNEHRVYVNPYTLRKFYRRHRVRYTKPQPAYRKDMQCCPTLMARRVEYA